VSALETIIEAYQAMAQERTTGSISSLTEMNGSAVRYVVGADIGGTSLRLALADGEGSVLGRWSASTADTTDAATVVRRIREGVDALLKDASLPADALSAIAAGAPGVTDTDQGVVIATSYLMGWRDVPLRAMLEDEFGVPAAIDNDVNVAAIGEQRAGVAQGAKDFVFLAVGTGLGAGIVLNGELHRGSVWMAGEIGYMLVPGTSESPAGRGEPGALEAIVGGEGIKSQWKLRWSGDRTALARDASPTQIFDAAALGDPLAAEVLQLVGRTLAYAIFNISLILNSRLFILGGSIGVHPALGDVTRAMLHERRGQVQPVVVASGLGRDAQLTGAIFLALQTAATKEALAAD
jgi:glucokinase